MSNASAAATAVAELSFTTAEDDLGMHAVAIDESVARALHLDRGLSHELRLWSGTRDQRLRSAVVVARVRTGEDGFRLAIAHRLQLHLAAETGKTLFAERVELKPCEEVALTPLLALPGCGPEVASQLIARTLARDFVPLSAGMELVIAFPGVARAQRFRVDTATPPESRFTARTRVRLGPEAPAAGDASPGAASYDEIGGLDRALDELRELLEFPLRAPEALRRAGITPCRGILLYGPPGTGKSLMVRAVATRTGAHLEILRGAEALAAGADVAVRASFARAADKAPAILLIDDIDGLAPRRAGGGPSGLASLLGALDGLERVDGVVVVGTTNRVNAIDPSLRRPGRFAREIHVPPPDLAGRLAILRIHSERMPLDRDARAQLTEVARRSHGFVGADLMGLCFDAGMNALRREADLATPGGWTEALASVVVTSDDFFAALARARPSALRETLFSRPDMTWDDVGGHDAVKERLREVVCLPLLEPRRFSAVRLTPPRGIVLHGPPGNGKTMLARAVAAECEANFIVVKGPELYTRWVGESEERLRELFQIARQTRPCIIFVDEIDALLPVRGGDHHAGVGDSMVNQFLSELDGIEPSDGVLVIGATNRLDRLDPAVLRPGRLGEHIEIGPPDAAARAAILRLALDRVPLRDGTNLDAALRTLVPRCEGWSAADLVALVDRAKYRAVRAIGTAPVVDPAWLVDEHRLAAVRRSATHPC